MSTFVIQCWLQFIRIFIKCLSIKCPYILMYFAPSHFTTSLGKVIKKHYVTNEIRNFLSSYLTQQHVTELITLTSLSHFPYLPDRHTHFSDFFLWNLEVHHGLVFMEKKFWKRMGIWFLLLPLLQSEWRRVQSLNLLSILPIPVDIIQGNGFRPFYKLMISEIICPFTPLLKLWILITNYQCNVSTSRFKGISG